MIVYVPLLFLVRAPVVLVSRFIFGSDRVVEMMYGYEYPGSIVPEGSFLQPYTERRIRLTMVRIYLSRLIVRIDIVRSVDRRGA